MDVRVLGVCAWAIFIAFSGAAQAVPVQAVAFVNVHDTPVPNGTRHARTCLMRLDALPGDPADAPSRTPSNRIAFSTNLQCQSLEVLRLGSAPFPDGYVRDDNSDVTKQIVSLSLERWSDPWTATVVSTAAVPAATSAPSVFAEGTFRSDTLVPTHHYRIRAVVKLTEPREYASQSVWSTSDHGYWRALSVSAADSADCQNVEEFAASLPSTLPTRVDQLQRPAYYFGYSYQTIQCTVRSVPFTMADIDGRHFLASASKFYKSCMFNSRRAGIVGGAAHMNYRPTDTLGIVQPNSVVRFTDPSAQCTPDDGATWDTVPVAFDFAKTGIDPCGSQNLADTQVLKGTLRINGGPSIPAKMLVRVTPLGPFNPIVNVSVVDDFSFDTSLSSTPTGQYLDVPLSQAPVLNDETESIANLYSYLTPMVAPAFGSNIYSVKVAAVDARDVVPVETSVPFLLADFVAQVPNTASVTCDRREIRFDFAGTLEEPADREEVSIGSGLYVPVSDNDPNLNPALEATGAAVSAGEAGDLLSALSSLGDVIKSLPKLPVAPPVPYTVTVEYLLGGIRQEATFAGMFGVPTAVVLPGVVTADAFVVTLGSTNQLASVRGVTQGDNADYMLRIQKVNAVTLLQNTVPALSALSPLTSRLDGCRYPTPVDITVNVGAKYLASLYGLPGSALSGFLETLDNRAVSVGYKALGANATSSPRDFVLVFQQHGQAGFSVHEGVDPCNAADPLNIEASYVNGSGQGTDIEIKAEMAPAVQAATFSSLKDRQNVKRLSYSADSPMTRFTAIGNDDGTAFDVRLSNLTNAYVCQHDGKLCNVGWRSHKKSETSFDFKSWDNNGNYDRAGVYVYYVPPGGLPKVFDVQLASFAVDSKLENAGAAFTNMGGYGLLYDVGAAAADPTFYNTARAIYHLALQFGSNANFPYWFYLNTDRQTVSGAVSTPTLTLAASGFSSRNRELYLHQHLYFLTYLHRRGSISCGDLSFDVTSASFTTHVKDVVPVTVPHDVVSSWIKSALCYW